MTKIFCAVLFFCSMFINAAVAYSGGSGTVANPYHISVPNDLYLLSTSAANWSSNFILTNNIDLTNFAFQPIGTLTSRFNGVFDGNGYSINGLVISGSTYPAPGFFAAVGTNGVVKNLTITNAIVSVTSTSSLYAGILVGYNSGLITNCDVNGKLSASAIYAYAGAIAGFNHSTGYISNCIVNSSVSTSYCGGGIAGYNFGFINGCDMTGPVITGTTTGAVTYAGGIAGMSGGFSTIANSLSAATVSSTITNPAKSAAAWAGGVVAFSEANAAVTNCISSANVSATVTGKPANAYAGGIAGRNDKAIIDQCVASGSVSAQASSSGDASTSYAGGMFGLNEGATANCYTNALVTSYATGSPNFAYAGGFAGYQSTSAVSNCYSTGAIISNTSAYLGAFIGRQVSGAVTASFWDTEASGIPTKGIGVLSGGTASVTGKTTAQMKTASTFTSAGWNFSQIWKMSQQGSYFAGYPVFMWQDDMATDVLEISLVSGWNWISFNVLPEVPSLNYVLSGYSASNNDVIVSGDGQNATYYNGVWYGTLTNIRAGLKYRFKSANSGILTVYGTYVDASLPINLVSGWNWLGYCLPQAQPLNIAISTLEASNNDVFVAPDGKNATYYNGVWYGTLETLDPGKGYMLKVAVAQAFVYPSQTLGVGGELQQRADMGTFAALAANWLFEDCQDLQWCDGADVDFSGKVDENDLIIVAENWLN